MNTITLNGRLTKDVEIKQLADNKAIAKISIASNGRKKDDDVNFFECKAFNGVANTCAKYLKKGSAVLVVGTMSQYKYNKQDGTTMTGWEVLIDNIEFLGGGEKTQQPKSEEVKEEVGELPF